MSSLLLFRKARRTCFIAGTTTTTPPSRDSSAARRFADCSGSQRLSRGTEIARATARRSQRRVSSVSSGREETTSSSSFRVMESFALAVDTNGAHDLPPSRLISGWDTDPTFLSDAELMGASRARLLLTRVSVICTLPYPSTLRSIYGTKLRARGHSTSARRHILQENFTKVYLLFLSSSQSGATRKYRYL